jgi:hypothetical protein
MSADLHLGLALYVGALTVCVGGVAYLAHEVKGRSAMGWGLFAFILQILALALPITAGALLGLFDPRLWLTAGLGAVPPDILSLSGELAMIAGGAALAVLAFQSQMRWKACPACRSRIGWASTVCPECLTPQPASPRSQVERPEKLTEFRVFLPLPLAERLRQYARESGQPGKKQKLGEDALVGRVIREWVSQKLDG